MWDRNQRRLLLAMFIDIAKITCVIQFNVQVTLPDQVIPYLVFQSTVLELDENTVLRNGFVQASAFIVNEFSQSRNLSA